MLTIRRLVWDAFNAPHIARHRVTTDEVEEVCHGDPEVLQTYGRRFLLIGLTAPGRMLAVVLQPRGRGVYYPVTARPASREERTYYAAQRGGTT